MPKTEIRGPWPYEIAQPWDKPKRMLLTQPILSYLNKHPGAYLARMAKDLNTDVRSIRRRVWTLVKRDVLYSVETVSKNGRKVAGYKVNV